jgi:hypothetical protein
MTYLNHITVSTGHTRRSPRAEVAGETIAVLQAWIKSAVAYIDPYPLPGPLGARVDGFAAEVSVVDGALICVVCDGTPLRQDLVTIAVAPRSRHAVAAWSAITAIPGAQTGLQAPAAPFCAAALHDAYRRQFGGSAWIGDFERCLAWAWIETKN